MSLREMKYKPLIRCRGKRHSKCGTKIKEENITFMPNKHPEKYPSDNLYYTYVCHDCGNEDSYHSEKILTKEYTDEEKIELFNVIYDMIEARFGRYSKRESEGFYYNDHRRSGKQWVWGLTYWDRDSRADKDVADQLEKLFEIIPAPDERTEREKKR